MQEKVDRQSWQPNWLSFSQLSSFISVRKELVIVDTCREQLEEIFLLRNPKYRFNKNFQEEQKLFVNKMREGKEFDEWGNWFFFPWINTLVHVLPENLHFEMRTGRNHFLITQEEQEKYYSATVGVLGLSVGSHAALTIAMTGGAKNFVLVDPDSISGSNLNRIRIGVNDLGLPKTVAVARKIFEINPYANIKIYLQGLTEENIDEVILNSKLDILIEEMDNPYFKFKSRFLAQEARIPVLMATDNGDNIFVDIERYDSNKKQKIFNGLAGDISLDQFKNLDPKDLPRVAAKIAGATLATSRMQQSVVEVGKSLYSWPQLGTAANLCGTALAYLIRKILVDGKKIKSGRYQINLDKIFESDYKRFSQKVYRLKETIKFIKIMSKK